METKQIKLDSGLNIEVYLQKEAVDLGQFGIITKELIVEGDLESNFLVFGDVTNNGNQTIGSSQGYNKDEANISSDSYYTGSWDGGMQLHDPTDDTVTKLEGVDNDTAYQNVVDALKKVIESYRQKVDIQASDIRDGVNVTTDDAMSRWIQRIPVKESNLVIIT